MYIMNAHASNNTKSNGRVSILEPDPSVQFSFADKINNDPKNFEYRESLTGNWNASLLSNLFFSSENISILQNGLKYGVYKLSNKRFVISAQCNDTLSIIMRSTFLTYSANKPDDITEQITALNRIVLDYCIPAVYGEAKGYLKYLEDASTLVVPLERPVQTDVRDPTLEIKLW